MIPQLTLTVDEGPIQQVVSITYLGVHISSGLTCMCYTYQQCLLVWCWHSKSNLDFYRTVSGTDVFPFFFPLQPKPLGPYILQLDINTGNYLYTVVNSSLEVLSLIWIRKCRAKVICNTNAFSWRYSRAYIQPLPVKCIVVGPVTLFRCYLHT